MRPVALRRTRCLAGFLLPALLVAPSLRAQEEPTADDLARQPLQGSIATEVLESRSLGFRTSWTVYRPPPKCAPPDAPLPLVLILHGLLADEMRWVRRGGPQVLEAEILAGRVPPVLAVAPAGGPGFWTDGRGEGQAWRSALLLDLMPRLEEKFRLLPGPGNRGILGLDLGGAGAVSIALEHPEIFGAVVAHTPIILPEKAEDLAGPAGALLRGWPLRRATSETFGDPIDPALWTRHHPLVLARGKAGLTAPRILALGAADDRFGGGAGARRLHEVLEAAAIPHTLEEVPGGRSWDRLREYLPRWFRFLTVAPEAESGPPSDRPR